MKIRQFDDPETPGQKQWWFICPGCKTAHAIEGMAPAFNGDFDQPSIDISIGTIYNKNSDRQCWVERIDEGRVHFHTRCHHEYAGTSAAMIDIEESEGASG